jgi:hypothetical protein
MRDVCTVLRPFRVMLATVCMAAAALPAAADGGKARDARAVRPLGACRSRSRRTKVKPTRA